MSDARISALEGNARYDDSLNADVTTSVLEGNTIMRRTSHEQKEKTTWIPLRADATTIAQVGNARQEDSCNI